MARIAIGGLWHETNTFAAGATELSHFERYQLARGEELLARYAEGHTELGGVIAEAPRHDYTLLPTLYAAAVPSGTISAEALRSLGEELASRLASQLPVHGVILAQHGAAVAEGADDADAYVIGRVREVVGPRTPIVATFDFHANVDAATIEAADLSVGYDTFPHVDMAARGREAAALLARMLDSGRRPARAIRNVPLLTSPQMQSTDDLPMREVMAVLREVESDPGVWCATVAMGFPYCDVPHIGASVVVYADEAQAAAAHAGRLAREVWERRARFEPALVPVADGVRAAVDSEDFPVVLVEPADNVGGGSAGDGAVILAALLEAKASGAVVVIADPRAVEAAEAVGVGGRFEAEVGGKTDALHGPPARVLGTVRKITDGRYVHKGTYMTGYVTSMGRTAVVESGGVQIVLTSLRTMPFDAEQLRCLSIEPAEQRIIVVKSATAWRAAYGEFARCALILDTPGVCASNLRHFRYTKRPPLLYPLDGDFPYQP